MTEEQLNEMAYDRALELMEAPMSFAIPSRELAKKLAGTEDEQIELAYGIDCFKMGYKQYAAEICLHLSKMFQKKLMYTNNGEYHTVPVEILDRLYANERKFEQMMKGAINAEIESDLDPHGADYGNQKLEVQHGALESKGYKSGTVVKLIIIKED